MLNVKPALYQLDNYNMTLIFAQNVFNKLIAYAILLIIFACVFTQTSLLSNFITKENMFFNVFTSYFKLKSLNACLIYILVTQLTQELTD